MTTNSKKEINGCPKVYPSVLKEINNKRSKTKEREEKEKFKKSFYWKLE